MSVRTQLFSCFILYLSGSFCASTSISEVKWKSETGLCFSFAWQVSIKRKKESPNSFPVWYLTNHTNTWVGKDFEMNHCGRIDSLFCNIKILPASNVYQPQNSHFTVYFFPKCKSQKICSTIFHFLPVSTETGEKLHEWFLRKMHCHKICWPK